MTEVVLTSALIFFARAIDVSMGTVRVAFVVRGQRVVASAIAFFEVLIWVFAVSQVVTNLHYPVYAVCFAGGFATGNFVGITIEKWIAHGEAVVRIISRQGSPVAEGIRGLGLRVAEFDGRGRSEPVTLLFAKIPRKLVGAVLARAREVDPACFYTVDNIASSSSTASEKSERSGWRAFLKRK